jgi:hypothetical protein
MVNLNLWHFAAQALILVGAIVTVIGLIRSLAAGDGRLAKLLSAMRGLLSRRRRKAGKVVLDSNQGIGASLGGLGTPTAEVYVLHNPPEPALTIEQRVERLEGVNIADALNHNADLQEVRAKLRSEQTKRGEDMAAIGDRVREAEVQIESRLRSIASDGVGLAAWGAALTFLGVVVDFFATVI